MGLRHTCTRMREHTVVCIGVPFRKRNLAAKQKPNFNAQSKTLTAWQERCRSCTTQASSLRIVWWTRPSENTMAMLVRSQGTCMVLVCFAARGLTDK